MAKAVSNVPDPEIGTVGVKDSKCYKDWTDDNSYILYNMLNYQFL